MKGLYLAALLVSLAGVGVLDARWRLVLGSRAPGRARRAVLVVVAGAVALLAFDLLAIRAGSVARGEGPALLGVEVLPHVPVEELVFVTFLGYLTLVVYAGVRRTMLRRAARDGGEATP